MEEIKYVLRKDEATRFLCIEERSDAGLKIERLYTHINNVIFIPNMNGMDIYAGGMLVVSVPYLLEGESQKIQLNKEGEEPQLIGKFREEVDFSHDEHLEENMSELRGFHRAFYDKLIK